MTHFWKDKTIVAYIALAHHTRFITPVMEAVKAQGARVKYIVGQAERSQEISAIELGLSYSHVYDYLSHQDQEDIAAVYEEMRKAFAPRLRQSFLLGILPATVTDKTMMSTAMEYVGFQRLVDKEKPDLCFALHELNRWGKMFAFWAKQKNVPFITLHEGLTYGLDFGYSGFAQYSTLNLVWGKRVKEKFTGYDAPGAKLIPVGNTHLSQEIALQAKKKVREKKRAAYKAQNATVVLCILPALLPAPGLLSPLLETVSQAKDLRLFIKFHPSCQKVKLESWQDQIPEAAKKNTYFIHGEESTYDLLSMSDLVVLGQQSTTGLEAIAFGKPLVKLDFGYVPNAPYSFVDKGVAAKLSPGELAEALKAGKDFSSFTDPDKVAAYLAHELARNHGVVETVCTLFQEAISANQMKISALPGDGRAPELDWTFAVPLPDDPDIFLSQIEAIALNSEGGGTYEAIFLVPPVVSEQMQQVLDSLKGEVILINTGETGWQAPALNQALAKARGKWILFLDKGLAPLKGWLGHLAAGIQRHETGTLFGARVADRQGKISSAGMVIDANHTPVPAYHHLEVTFPPVLKERAFQMTDHFLAVEKEQFLALGGITDQAGDFAFMDLCLKAGHKGRRPAPVVYLPDLQLIFLSRPRPREDNRDAVYFFSRWTGALQESESALHQRDGIQPETLNHARLATAMKGLF